MYTMRWQHIMSTLFVGMGLLVTGTGCSSLNTNSPTIQTAEAKNWINQQMKAKQAVIHEWEEIEADANQLPADHAIAQLAINILSKNVASLIEENGDNKSALLASVMRKEKQPTSTDLPSLASLKITEKNQLDGGKTLYRLEGKVFTSTPDKLYPVTLTVRVSKQGIIEYFEVDK
jgi:hypothetical protein